MEKRGIQMKGVFEGKNTISDINLEAIIYILSIYKILKRQCKKTKYSYNFIEMRNKGHPTINDILTYNRNKILIGG